MRPRYELLLSEVHTMHDLRSLLFSSDDSNLEDSDFKCPCKSSRANDDADSLSSKTCLSFSAEKEEARINITQCIMMHLNKTNK